MHLKETRPEHTEQGMLHMSAEPYFKGRVTDVHYVPITIRYGVWVYE